MLHCAKRRKRSSCNSAFGTMPEGDRLQHQNVVSLGMNVTTRQLKAFVLTARHQSFSRAAEELFITQSGMSVLVRELETQLGFRLFERTTRKVMLTEPGSKFLPVADRSLRELETAALHL